jgi:hypothetical protein
VVFEFVHFFPEFIQVFSVASGKYVVIMNVDDHLLVVKLHVSSNFSTGCFKGGSSSFQVVEFDSLLVSFSFAVNFQVIKLSAELLKLNKSIIVLVKFSRVILEHHGVFVLVLENELNDLLDAVTSTQIMHEFITSRLVSF